MNERFRFHESAHATMAMACGLQFTALMAFSSGGMLQLSGLKAEQLASSDFRKRYALATVAGACGEAILYRESPLISLDSGMAQTDMKNLASLGLSLQEILQTTHDATVYLLAHWQSVQAVAASLEQCPLISPLMLNGPVETCQTRLSHWHQLEMSRCLLPSVSLWRSLSNSLALRLLAQCLRAKA